MAERMMVGKRYLYFYQRLSYKRYIATIFNLDLKPSVFIVGWGVLIISTKKV